jgi:Protein of unknown function (DUF3551)
MFRNWTTSEPRSITTRLLISIFVLVTALFAADRSASAQSAYSYPWCLERGIGGPRSCYYSSYEQCRYEAYTRGGFCTESPYYRRSQDRLVGTGEPRHRRHRPHS